MDAAGAEQRRPLRLVGLVAAGTVVVLALAALVLFIWLRAYAPLDVLGAGSYAAGAGLGVDIEPVAGSGGKTVFIPVYKAGRPFDTAFTLHNTGRFAVTVTGLARVAGHAAVEPVVLFGSDSSTANADASRLRPFRKLRLEPGDTATMVVRWQLTCRTAQGAQSFSDSVPLRYRYLSLFTRSERVELPFAVTLRCAGGPPARS